MKAKLAALRGEFERGGFLEAVVRMLIAVIKKRGVIDRRSFLIAHEISEHRSGQPAISEADLQVSPWWLSRHCSCSLIRKPRSGRCLGCCRPRPTASGPSRLWRGS